jgi:hypothetical protein
MFNFCAVVTLKNINDELIWRLIVIYKPAYDEHKLDFINELHCVMGDWLGPFLIGGI